MQLRRLAALERQRIVDDLAKIEAEIADLEDILAKPERQRRIVHDELAEIVDKHGDERRTRIIAADGDVNDEDLIAREDVVVTITETGYAKRTKTDLYRSQKRGGKGVQGAGLKQDDIVRHFFVCSTHDWILFFTTQGRVYRAKAYELPEASRTARGQHVANLRRAGSTAPRPTNCRRPRGPLAVSTSRTCWPSNPRNASPRSSRFAAMRMPPTWCWRRATGW